MLKRLVNQCTIDLSLEAIDPLLVKSGGAAVNGADMAFVRTSRNNELQPFLPGSGLKGVLRSHAERIARTLKARSVCDVFRRAPIQGCSARVEKTGGPADYRNVCPACRLFGSLRWRGRFHIDDGYLTEASVATSTELRDGIAIDRVTGGVAGNAKFDMEVLPAGVAFGTQLRVVNFEMWQLGWLAYVLRDLADGHLSVGSGTSRGLGRVRGTLRCLTLGYIGEPALLERALPGIGALVTSEDRTAYGLAEDDQVSLPEGLAFDRAPGSLRKEATRTGHADVLATLAALTPAWHRHLERTTPIPA